MAYATRSDMELHYGKSAIERFADAENQSSATEIDARITWALDTAQADMDGRLARMYDLPFSSPYPTILVTMNALLAGVVLSNHRKVFRDTDARMLSMQLAMFGQYMKEILAGQRQLLDPSTSAIIEKAGLDAPFAITEEEDE